MVSFTQARPYLAGLCAALLWAGNFVVGKYARFDLPPVTLALFRWLMAFLLLTPFVLPGLVNKLAPIWRAKGTVLVLAVSGITLTNTLVYVGLGMTSANHAVLINAAMPACVVLVAFLANGARMAPAGLLGILLSGGGVLAMVLSGRGEMGGLAGGDAWVMLAVGCWAVYTVWQQRLPADVDRYAVLWVLMGCGCLPLVPFAIHEWLNQPVTLSVRAMLSVSYLAIGPSLLAMLAYDHTIRQLGAARAGMFLNLIPVFGTVLSMALLGEAVGLPQAMALLAIALGLVVANLPEGRVLRWFGVRAGA